MKNAERAYEIAAVASAAPGPDGKLMLWLLLLLAVTQTEKSETGTRYMAMDSIALRDAPDARGRSSTTSRWVFRGALSAEKVAPAGKWRAVLSFMTDPENASEDSAFFDEDINAACKKRKNYFGEVSAPHPGP